MKKILVSALLSACYSLSYAAEPLFLAKSGSRNIQGQVKAGLTQGVILPFEGDASVINAQIGLRINPKALDADEMTITLPNGKTVSSKRIKRYTTHGGSTVWIGKSTKASLGTLDYVTNETHLVVRDGRIFGSVTVNGKRYMVNAASDGSHVLAEFKMNNVIPDHDERAYKAAALTVPPLPQVVSPVMSKSVNRRIEFAEFDQEKYLAQAKAQFGSKNVMAAIPSDYVPVVRILVNFTAKAEAYPSGATNQQAIEWLVDQVNLAALNSLAPVRFSLAFAAPVTYTETGNVATDLDRYWSSTDTFMNEVHTSRQTHLADVAVLLTNATNANACGRSKEIKADATQAYVVVDMRCAIGNNSFSHEIAHLFGARHDAKADDLQIPYKFGHGFKQGSAEGDVRTIMAYPDLKADGSVDPNDLSVRTNYFSTPDILHPNGRAIGNTGTANVVRVLRERAADLSKFQSAPLTYEKTRATFKISQSNSELYVQDTTLGVPDSETILKAGTNSITFTDMRVNLNTARQAKTIPADKLQSLIELYIAFMNRLPDSDGLEYWIGEVKRGQTINQIAENFYDAAVSYSNLTGYSTAMSHSDFVIKVYKNVLARTVTASDSGVVYWTGELSSGRQSRGQVVSSILTSAHGFKGDATWGWVANLLDNKLFVGNYFSLKQGLSYRTGETSITKTMQIAAAVTPTDTAAAIRILGLSDQLDLTQ
ncbi:DUF4214 domain-containing protein [Undibacterium flavidum]|uniref:DUF4214 domain-containing protein n=1 Tax=Undibacterium flavidum TaxID=2762297 RepID=A0ABR6YDQ2_9BURK|nr:DUF4214 domain-containing protein [Undibacterium flavidum]MBC3874690.1 DUF4214 domain-containing protein [Undibacterium flavidum]